MTGARITIPGAVPGAAAVTSEMLAAYQGAGGGGFSRVSRRAARCKSGLPRTEQLTLIPPHLLTQAGPAAGPVTGPVTASVDRTRRGQQRRRLLRRERHRAQPRARRALRPDPDAPWWLRHADGSGSGSGSGPGRR